MNARIDMNTPEEAAKSIGVCTAVVTSWCRNGVINCNKVGGGTQKERYEISDDEVNYIRKMIHKFGAKQGILRYRKDWRYGQQPHDSIEVKAKKEAEQNKISPECEYLYRDAAHYIGVDESLLRRACREEKINCRVEKNPCGKGNHYYIPGWEVLYLKGLYDRYGKVGRFSAMYYYVKDRNESAVHDKPSNEPDEMVDGVIEYKKSDESKPFVTGKEVYDAVTNSEAEPLRKDKKIKLTETFNYILDVKERILDCKEELRLLEEEYNKLKEELDDALNI